MVVELFGRYLNNPNVLILQQVADLAKKKIIAS